MATDKETIALVALIELTDLIELAGQHVKSGEYGDAARAVAGLLDIGDALAAGLVAMEAKRLGITPQAVCGCGNCQPQDVKKDPNAPSSYN